MFYSDSGTDKKLRVTVYTKFTSTGLKLWKNITVFSAVFFK